MTCPNCNKPTQYEGNPSRPFCSERCKMIDLGKWAGEIYRMPTQERPSDSVTGTSFNDDDFSE